MQPKIPSSFLRELSAQLSVMVGKGRVQGQPEEWVGCPRQQQQQVTSFICMTISYTVLQKLLITNS